MIFDYETLKLIWWALVGILLIGFAITDGMDMGACSLLPFVGQKDEERRVVINVVGPHWDGNQVWFITAGGAIFAAWPAAYAAAFSGFYMAMLLVLFALFFRPVGFDYRSKLENPKWRKTWDWGLFAGSAIPSIIFGVAFGNLIQGVPFHFDEFLKPHYEGFLLTALLPLLNPFALLAGLLSFAMLAMHGGVWLQLRTEAPIANRAKKAVTIMGLAAIVLYTTTGLWSAFLLDGYQIVSQPDPNSLPNPLAKEVIMVAGGLFDIYKTMPIAIIAPALAFAGFIFTVLLSRLNRPGFAFFTSSLSMAGVISSAGLVMFPFIMPSSTNPNSSLTLWDATSSHLTLTVMFWAVVIFLPFVLLYTLWCYRRMWGKVTIEEIKRRAAAAY